MQTLIDAIKNLYTEWKNEEPVSIDVLPISGSERRYFRLHGKEGPVIGTYGANVKENESFIYFSDHFHKKNLTVPKILAVSDDRMYYLQQDFGNTSLLNCLEADGYSQPVYDLFKKSLAALASLQI